MCDALSKGWQLGVGLAVALAVAMTAGVLHRGEDRSWPSYAEAFTTLAPVVVHVAPADPGGSSVGSGFAVSSTGTD